MRLNRIILGVLSLAYLAGLAQRFGIVIGLYVSLLVVSFLVLFTPLISWVSVFSALACSNTMCERMQISWVTVWAALSGLNVLTLMYFPIIYTKTVLTSFLYHMFLVPSAGSIPVIITGVASVYHWAIARFGGRMRGQIAWHLIGACAATIAFYFFMQSRYFELFVISLNSSHINY